MFVFSCDNIKVSNFSLRRVDPFPSCVFLLLKIKNSSFQFFFLRAGPHCLPKARGLEPLIGWLWMCGEGAGNWNLLRFLAVVRNEWCPEAFLISVSTGWKRLNDLKRCGTYCKNKKKLDQIWGVRLLQPATRQNLQENTYVGVFVNKAGWSAGWFKTCNSMKKYTPVQVFSCEFYKIFKNTFFTEHPWVTVSGLFDFRGNYCLWKSPISRQERARYLWKVILSLGNFFVYQKITPTNRLWIEISELFRIRILESNYSTYPSWVCF